MMGLVAARLRAAVACLWLAACMFTLAGCASLVPQTIALRADWPAGVPQSLELTRVPFFPQEDYQCGPAALAMLLADSGVAITAEALVPQVWLPARHGSLQLEMLAAARRNGRIPFRLTHGYPQLLSELAAGRPVLVLQDLALVPWMPAAWHYAVVVGFDYPSGTIFLRSGSSERLAVPFTAFERTWMQSSYWAMTLLRPGEIPADAPEDSWVEALIAFQRTAPTEAVSTAYKAALERWPDNLPAAVGLANELHTRGLLADAVAVLRNALRNHPDSVILMNNLAQSLSDLGRQEEALAQIERAMDPRSPFSADVRITRALILRRIRLLAPDAAASGRQ